MNEKTDELVLSKVEGNVGYIIFNRSDHLNTFNLALAEQFLVITNNFQNDDTVRVIVIRGNGKVFSAGGDIKEMLNDVQGGKDRAAYFRDPLATFNKMTLSLRENSKPVIAAVHGAVAGVAFNLMLGCDLRIAKEGTRFTQAFIRIGLSPDGGGTYFLPRLVGYARACELTMLPTELDAHTALSWGLINRVLSAASFEEEIKRTAEILATSPMMTIGRTKKLLNETYERCLGDQMEAERLAQIENATSDNFKEGLQAFIDRRQPKFNIL
jgi:2-(1,2-epoxy-1,2-dihydrophenyl)acetyl-CoA isomerase